MTDLNPIMRYTFKSQRSYDSEVTIKSRLGIDAARNAAMIHFWGPLPDPVVPTRNGLGLDLMQIEEAE